MIRFILQRILWTFVVLIVLSMITFGLMHSVPGGPFDREKPLPPETIRILNEKFHLDEPLPVQYGIYLYDILIPRITDRPSLTLADSYLINIPLWGKTYFRWMNFGPSLRSRSRTVNDIMREQLPVSFQLGVFAIAMGVLIGMPLGVIAALKQNTLWDYLGMSVAIFGVSVPVIAMGPLLVWIFGVALKWLPPSGWGSKPPYLLFFIPRDLGWSYWQYAILPTAALGITQSAVIARLTRASLLQVIREDYIRTARAKGLTERIVITRHALRNALIPVVTVLGPMFAALVTGTFVVEQIFAIPGLGRYFINSITGRDYPVIMGTTLLWGLFLLAANLVVDIAYAWLDPRIRYE
jgi:ABC-type dipeptide/oligopeptide/nickel transport system permease component